MSLLHQQRRLTPGARYSVLSTRPPVPRPLSPVPLFSAFILAAGSLLSAQDTTDLEEDAIRAAAARVAPSVVKIETIGGLERVGGVLVSTGPTTGLAVAADGYVISSAFNFIQQPSSILVTLPSGARGSARIVARDKSRMLVLLKVNTQEKLALPEAAPKKEMTVGQWAIAVGRTFDQQQPNISVGVVSATNRIWSRAIQTDAKISPANYGGPLVDIAGRVLGVLVPLSPQGQGEEVAGAEWYDSGIGFAIPLADILERLPAMRSGQDIHPGLMGISLKAGDIYSLPAEIAAVQPLSPAYKAGLKSGDTIVEIAGQPISRQSHLKHALGPRYAGDKLPIAYLRGQDKDKPERKQTEVELIDKLLPYEHPFLGILPRRDAATGVTVRFVYPDSPAAKAGLKIDDRIVGFGDQQVANAAELRLLVANLEPKAKATLQVERGGEALSLELTHAKLPTAIPADLPPHQFNPPAAAAEKPTTGILEIKLPEEPNECFAYVPENYRRVVPHGLVVVLSAPGKVDRDKLAERWKAVCEQRQLVVLAPMSAAADKWQSTESAVIRKFLDDALNRFSIDPTRVATYGYQAGGAMAFLVGCEHTDRVRAVVALEALPPPRTKVPENDPINRLAIFLGHAEKSPAAEIIKALAERLTGLKLPVTEKPLGDTPRDLNDAELAELARWLDTLDRI